MRAPGLQGDAQPDPAELVRHQRAHFMKRLFSSPDTVQVGLLRSRLEVAGIRCEIRNEHLSPAMPGAPFYPELWVLDDAQFTEASELLAAWRQSSQTES